MNRHNDRRNRDHRDSRGNSQGTGKRVFWIVLAMVIAAVSVHQMTSRPTAQPPRAAKPLASLTKPRDLQDQAAEQGILGGVKAGKEALASLKRPQADVQVGMIADTDFLLHEPTVEKTDKGYRVTGARSEKPYVIPRDEAEAKEDARQVARAKLAEELRGLSPALEDVHVRLVKLTPEQQKQIAVNDPDAKDRAYVVLDVQTSEEAVRKERSKERFGRTAVWGGAGFLVLLVGYGFLRLDMWTKGYLTTTLAVIALLLVGGGLLVAFAG